MMMTMMSTMTTSHSNPVFSQFNPKPGLTAGLFLFSKLLLNQPVTLHRLGKPS